MFDELMAFSASAPSVIITAWARRISWEVHTKGSAAVYAGPRERCEAVAAVLEQIGLRVLVTQ
ncbi:MAG: ATP-dependent Clp protease adaptor ClpS [Elusimicrobia bacterium]|nr:ATP-dependent Clp protease adaptor ClpS [Elusimicrobiota bacterium]